MDQEKCKPPAAEEDEGWAKKVEGKKKTKMVFGSLSYTYSSSVCAVE